MRLLPRSPDGAAPAARPGRAAPPLEPARVARAARVLWVRSRREATSWLVGSYASAFRGGGIEFDELRPYVPGDDVRAIDWNATARTGTPWVKRFREERGHTVLVALDVSASMRFGSTGRSKADSAAHAAALVAAAAGQAGDRVGLVAFAGSVRAAIEPGRGDAHTWRLVRAAVECAGGAEGATRLVAAADWVLSRTRRRAVVVLISDLRDADFAGGEPPARLATLGSRHDLVSIVVEDPRETALVAAGGLRLADPEGGGRALLGTGRRRRARYAAAAAARRARLERGLARIGADAVWLDTSADPLRVLLRFFRGRVERREAVR
jgi:uncharacterized protein (DUF58 family)